MGVVLGVQAKGTVSNPACKVVSADITSVPPPVSLLGPPASPFGRDAIKGGGSGFMSAGASVSTPTGDGDLVFDFRFGGAAGSIFATPVPGSFPPVILHRTFFPARDPSQLCYDEFVIHLVKE